MEEILQLESARLVMRQWRDADLTEFARMCADPQVMRYFPARLSHLESAALIGRIRGHFAEYGFGLWALQRKDTGEFIGLTGLQNVSFEAGFTPLVEIGWRLAREHWGLGYASEAAVDRAALWFRPSAVGRNRRLHHSSQSAITKSHAGHRYALRSPGRFCTPQGRSR